MSRRVAVLVVLCWLALAADPALAAGGGQLLLVTGTHSNIPTLSPDDVRRLYLGTAFTTTDGQPIEPLRNTSDPLLEEVFLQKVMFMSGPMYERALMLGVVRAGGARPTAYRSVADLLQALRGRRNTVSYVWRDAILNADDLRIVGVLWQKSGE